MRRRTPLLLVLALLLATSACASDDGYTVAATFPAAVGLYEGSPVEVMGLRVGTVDEITLADDGIAVRLRIDGDVPLPDDVRATILPRSLIGERTVVLHPAHRAGDRALADGAEIPPERVRLPAEVDETLEAFNELARELDPERVGDFLGSARGFMEGRGDRLHRIITDVETVTDTFAEQDEQLVALAEHLADLAGTLNARDDQLGRVIASYARTTGQLADEREQLLGILEEGRRLTDEGDALLQAIGEDLPTDLGRLAEVAQVLDQNADQVEQAVTALPDVVEALTGAHRTDSRTLHARLNAGGAIASLVRGLLEVIGVPLAGAA